MLFSIIKGLEQGLLLTNNYKKALEMKSFQGLFITKNNCLTKMLLQHTEDFTAYC